MVIGEIWGALQRLVKNEQRISRRIPPYESMVVQIASADESMPLNPVVMACPIMDISEGGLRLLAPCNVSIGSQLELTVSDTESGQSEVVYGAVRWTSVNTEGEGYYMGIKIDQEHLEPWVDIAQIV